MQPADFATLAKGLKYDSELEMFQDLYYVKKCSQEQLATLLGYSIGTTRRRMKSLGMKFRRPGGPNRLGMSKLATLPDEAFEHIVKSYATFNLSKSAMFKEKRRRKLGNIESGSVVEDQGDQLLLSGDTQDNPRPGSD